MITLVAATDLHMTDTPPRSRIDDYVESLFDKYGQIGALADKVKADGIFFGGDIFHIKTPTKNSHRLVARLGAATRAFGRPVGTAVGNHDLRYNLMDTLPEQPLGVMFHHGTMVNLCDTPMTFERNKARVKLVASPFQLKGDATQAEALVRDEPGQLVVGVLHQYASLKGGTAYQYDELGGEPVIKYADLLPYDPSVYFFGHWHIDQGVEKVGDKYFINIGSMSRGSLAKENLERVPKMVIIRIRSEDDYEVEEVPFKVRPAGEAFDLERKAKVDEEAKRIEEFALDLKSKVADTEPTQITEKLESMIDDTEVREMVLELLEEAGLEVRGTI